MGDMRKNRASDPNAAGSDVMTRVTLKSGRSFGVLTWTLTLGFLWTDIRAMFPWFEALVDKIAG